MDYAEEREEVAYFMRRLYVQGLTTCSGGNISCLVNGSTVLITPSEPTRDGFVPSRSAC